MTDHTDAPDIMERMKARMERHEVGWLTWREADARAFFAEIERLRRELLDTLHNDERHVIERDEARAELERLRKVERAARDYFDAVDRGYPFTPNLGAIRTALAFPDPTSDQVVKP